MPEQRTVVDAIQERQKVVERTLRHVDVHAYGSMARDMLDMLDEGQLSSDLTVDRELMIQGIQMRGRRLVEISGRAVGTLEEAKPRLVDFAKDYDIVTGVTGQLTFSRNPVEEDDQISEAMQLSSSPTFKGIVDIFPPPCRRRKVAKPCPEPTSSASSQTEHDNEEDEEEVDTYAYTYTGLYL